MKKALAIAMAVICAATLAFGVVMPAQAAGKSTADRISLKQAKEIALKEVGGGTVREIELEREKGKSVYEVEIRYDGTKYEVYVDAASGSIIRVKPESTSKKKTSVSTQEPSSQTATKPAADTSASSQISVDKAEEIALAKVGGGTVKEIELDRKNGKPIYEVEIKYNRQEYEVEIDAVTGEILQCEIDD